MLDFIVTKGPKVRINNINFGGNLIEETKLKKSLKEIHEKSRLTLFPVNDKPAIVKTTPYSFDQYLKHKAFPELELKFNEGTIDFRWKTDVENFKMPFECKIGTKSLRYEATNAWQSAPIQLKNPTDFSLDENKFLFTSSVLK